MLLSLETHSTLWSKGLNDAYLHSSWKDTGTMEDKKLPLQELHAVAKICATLGWSHVEF